MNELVIRREGSTSLWQNHAFMRLWLAQLLSNAGTEITTVAIPLTAVMALNATSAQMGWLGVASSLPNLLFALFGRVIAARRVLIFGASAAGAALGGFFGDTAGFRATMVIGTMIIAIGLLLLFLSPVRHVRDLPNSGHK